MKKFGKKITTFLIDGDPNGRQACELSNWTGKALKIPRTLIKESDDRAELGGTGVYLLIGKDPADPTEDMVYIGETEGLLDRLKQHISAKEFWNEAVAFLSKDENLNKAHIKYLEFRMLEIATVANRYKIENQNQPSEPSISEADKSEMEEFIENARMLINTLGYKVFESLRDDEIQTKETSPIFYITSNRGANATGKRTTEGFLVHRDSIFAKGQTDSFPNWGFTLLEKLRGSDTIHERNDGSCVLVKDHLFTSPSTASTIVLGRSSNGLAEWKTKEGVTLSQSESTD